MLIDEGSDYIRVCGSNLMKPSPKIDLLEMISLDRRRKSAKELTLLTRRAIETTKRRNSRSKLKNDRLRIGTVPE